MDTNRKPIAAQQPERIRLSAQTKRKLRTRQEAPAMTDDRAGNPVFGEQSPGSSNRSGLVLPQTGNSQVSNLAPSRCELAGPRGISAHPDPRIDRSYSSNGKPMSILSGCTL